MNELILEVRLDSFVDPVGVLVRDAKGALAFAYTPEHAANPAALALSLSLPLSEEPYEDTPTRAFFDNLLQERDGVLRHVMAREGLSRDDVAGLLAHIGRDCPGAISVLPQGATPSKIPGDLERDYEPLSDAQVEAIVQALHERAPLPESVRDPSPLSGVQSKIALTLLADGRFGEPRSGSGAPTTHIIKAPDQRHKEDAALEAAALDLCAGVGLVTAEARILRVGVIEVLLATRFDRGLTADGRIARLHQEDFAQALGLPATLKYERNAKTALRFDARAIGGVLAQTLDPSAAREDFVRAVLFDLMIGNVDAHAKNHALLHHPGGGVSLTPRYDVIPTRLDHQLTDELAFKIGGATTLETITGNDVEIFLDAIGVPRANQRPLIEMHAPRMAAGLVAAFTDLDRKRMKRFADLIAYNIEILFGALSLAVPIAAKNRDAFIERGGGWATS
jgi:serine/threonine-protein kinase HipA